MKKRLDSLEIALGNEQAERAFYLQHAKKTSNVFGKRMFEKIAAEEKQHYERLRQLQEKWRGGERWPEDVPLSVSGTEVKSFIRSIAREASTLPAGNENDLAAVRTALDFEARGEKFYAVLRDQSADPREKAFFDLLSGIEREHYLSLKDMEEFLTDPAAWYKKKERSGWLDGGA
jgi:rubrerythrin